LGASASAALPARATPNKVVQASDRARALVDDWAGIDLVPPKEAVFVLKSCIDIGH
jgi:hypothetical protein